MTSVGLAEVADDVRRGEGLARAGDAQQRLVAVAGLEGFGQFGDRLRLVALGLVVRSEFKGHPASVACDGKPRAGKTVPGAYCDSAGRTASVVSHECL